MRSSTFLSISLLALSTALSGCGSDTESTSGGGSSGTSTSGGGGSGGDTGGSGGTTTSGGSGGSGTCTPGDKQSCYEGKEGTEGVGLCKAGTQTCKANGEGFGPCTDQVLPTAETCATLGDDDCNGLVNEGGPDCSCTPGEMQSCYSGPMETIDIGLCHGGTQACKLDGTGYGPCEGEIAPQAETCVTPDDEDCDGQINEEGMGCVCVPGTMMACYTGPAGTENVGICLGGSAICNFAGTEYGPCTGEVTPQDETCFTPDDDDCDGQINEEGLGCVCVPNSMVTCYTGPMGTAGVGACKSGTAPCNALGTGIGACSDEVLPTTETCLTPEDDDCDGLVNEEGVGCTCTPGATQPCYSGPAGTEGVGTCKGGVQTCSPNGSGFGACVGEVLPAVEDCSTPANEDCLPGPDCGGAAWAKKFGAAGDQQINALARDGQNNVLIAGRFAGSFGVGGTNLTSAGGYDIFVAKLDAAGTPLWALRFGDAAIYQEAFDVASDAQGDVFVTGYFEGTLNVGGTVLMSAGATDAFLVKLDPNGAVLWAKRFGAGGAQLGQSLAVDLQGNVALVANGFTSMDFGGGALPSAGNYDMYVAKLDPAGNYLWSKRFGGPNADFAQGIAADSAGNIVFTGKSDTALDFGGGALPGAGGLDALVVKLDPLGSYLWDKRFGDGANQFGVDVATDIQNDVLLAGGFEGSVNLGGGALTAVGAVDVFLAKLTSGGAHTWSKRVGAAGANPSVVSIAASPGGDLFIAGQFDGTVNFGGASLTATAIDAFAARFDGAGAHVWSKRFGAGGNQYATGIAVDGLGAVLLGGYFEQTIDLGTGNLSSSGGLDMFVGKLSP